MLQQVLRHQEVVVYLRLGAADASRHGRGSLAAVDEHQVKQSLVGLAGRHLGLLHGIEVRSNIAQEICELTLVAGEQHADVVEVRDQLVDLLVELARTWRLAYISSLPLRIECPLSLPDVVRCDDALILQFILHSEEGVRLRLQEGYVGLQLLGPSCKLQLGLLQLFIKSLGELLDLSGLPTLLHFEGLFVQALDVGLDLCPPAHPLLVRVGVEAAEGHQAATAYIQSSAGCSRLRLLSRRLRESWLVSSTSLTSSWTGRTNASWNTSRTGALPVSGRLAFGLTCPYFRKVENRPHLEELIELRLLVENHSLKVNIGQELPMWTASAGPLALGVTLVATWTILARIVRLSLEVADHVVLQGYEDLLP